MELLEEYFKLQKKIYEYFDYVEDWVVIPLDDATEMYWQIDGGEGYDGSVVYCEIKEAVEKRTGQEYGGPIYTQRFLPKWVYRADDYTMICIDTQTDGNKFLMVFDNKKEVNEIS